MSWTENRKKKRRFYKRKGFLIFCLVCLVIGGIALVVVDKKLDPYRDIANAYELERIGEVEEASLILDRKGREIGRVFVENRSKIPLSEIPPVFIDAMIAQEDQRFFKHDGVDWIGVGRAVYLNAKSGGITQGAGTVTMQLARNAFDLLGEARRKEWSGYERKMIEAFLAIRIEESLHDELRGDYPDDVMRKKIVKEQILEFYLNRVLFGYGYFGVRSASLGYFGKEPVDLDVHECASIVACLKNPRRLDPKRNPSENKTARDHVLRRMALEGMITDAERDRMLKIAVVVDPDPILRGKSYLYERVAQDAHRLVGEETLSQGGYVIRTTIDYDIQRAAEQKLSAQLEEIESKPGYAHPKHADFVKDGNKNVPEYLQGALLMVDHGNGEVLAHVGGRDYSHSQFDFLQIGRRPIGTAFFPFIYAAAFERGLGPASPLLDEQMNNRALMVGGTEGVVGEWGMEIPDPQYEGQITARRALEVSKIAASVRLGIDVGLEQVAETARGFGLDIPDDRLRNRMLVGWDKMSLPELTLAYTAFPRGGNRVSETFYVREIWDSEGKPVFTSDHLDGSPPSESSCSDATAFQVHTILNDVATRGNLAEASSGLSEAPFQGGAKTGTPYGFTDAWMVGYNSRITCGVWMGFHKGGRKAIHGDAFAKNLAYPLWQETMNSALPDFRGGEIAQPDSIEKMMACRTSGMRPTRYCNEAIENPLTGALSFRSTSYEEYFRKGEQVGICSIHGSSGGSNQLAQREPQRESLPVPPVKSKAPLLLGFDPYQSQKPSLAPEDETVGFFLNQNTLIVDDQVRGEREALLKLSRPARFELPADE
ncbi:transglycosylase domain-containing protein [Akkermansiaceae bacterium]|nr:transglycosylase domain-containing protein [Akkermansiaceae bacterium]MDB4434076.1 transglycosylase domain-containing protein [Akkermansiaceae bacterium]